MSSSRKIQKQFSLIYDQNIDKIYRFIFFKVSSQDIAQDLCSETFLRSWKAYQRSQDEIENMQAFLYRVARNLVYDYYREKGRTKIVSTDNVPIIDPKVDLEEESEMNSDMNVIKSALTDLKPEYQEMIIWYYLDDLSVSEIASLANKSKGAVRVMIHRALTSIKGKIKEV